MKFQGPMLVVNDIEKSQKFYKEVLGLKKILDYGANVTLTGGFSLQTKESWLEFIHKDDSSVLFGGNNFEIYFEEDDFDDFIQRISKLDYIEYVHPVCEHSWGQRGVRFYDPDKHIIEVGENLKSVCKRFLNSGLTIEEVAQRMGVPIEFVEESTK